MAVPPVAGLANGAGTLGLLRGWRGIESHRRRSSNQIIDDIRRPARASAWKTYIWHPAAELTRCSHIELIAAVSEGIKVAVLN